MAVRNSAVARGYLSASGNTSVFTVPANEVLLLKNIALSQSSGQVSTYSIFVTTPGASVIVFLAEGSIPAGQPVYWSGWTALNAGDSLFLNVGTPTVGYWVSGALLPFNAAL